MTDAQKFFLQQSIFFARKLSHCDCLTFLRGMLESCPDTPEFNQVRDAFIKLHDSDAQLELIQLGQLKLKL